MSGLKTVDQSDVGMTWVMDEPMARASHALLKDGQVWIVDPVDDPEAMAKVAELGEPAGVIQLLDRHNRDCATIAERLDVPLLGLPDELGSTPFEAINVVDRRLWKEKALWWPEMRCLIVAEALGSNRMYRPGAAGAGVHIAMRLTPPRKQLGTYLPEHLLFGHGAPIHGPGATEALQQSIDRSVRDIPGAIVGLPRAFTSG